MGTQITERRCRFPALLLLFVFAGIHCGLLPAKVSAQEGFGKELAVNLAEGRVVICVAKDGILVATVEEHTEPGSRQPVVVPISALRAGVLLGAVEWIQPGSSDKPVRLDTELAHVIGAAVNASGRNNEVNAANDIESIGVAVLERIRELAGQFYSKINIGEDEPLIRLVLTDYEKDYGPEAWTIDYHIRQDSLGNDIWRTRVLRPSYTQIYPPEKGQPHTLMEVRYPPANRAKDAPELLDLLRQNDTRLAPMRSGTQAQAQSVNFVIEGQSQKSMAGPDADFLRAALPAVTPAGTKLTMGLIDYDRGMKMLIGPAEPPPAAPADDKSREPDAPTLRRKSSN
jgi:hypothetical protein